jgi:hypothetical protein
LFLFAVFIWNLIRLLGFLLLSCARAAARLVLAEELGEKRRSQGSAGKRPEASSWTAAGIISLVSAKA